MPVVSFSGGNRLLRPKSTTGISFRKDLRVERSVSVLLPVNDAQATLSDSVQESLDWLADHATQFELLIIDNGSTDATSEIGHELIRHYPQVRMISHRTPLGQEAAIRTGLSRSRGEVVMVREQGHRYRVVAQRTQTQVAAAAPVASRPSRPNYLGRLQSAAQER